jgi:hypothetical protein
MRAEKLARAGPGRAEHCVRPILDPVSSLRLGDFGTFNRKEARTNDVLKNYN